MVFVGSGVSLCGNYPLLLYGCIGYIGGAIVIESTGEAVMALLLIAFATGVAIYVTELWRWRR